MKGRISPQLASILKDPSARKELNASISKGGGVVVLGTDRFRVRVEQVEKSAATQKPKVAGTK
jgi:hypothetical protein